LLGAIVWRHLTAPRAKGIHMHAHDFANIGGVASREDPCDRQPMLACECEHVAIAGEEVIVIQCEGGVWVFAIRVCAGLVEK